MKKQTIEKVIRLGALSKALPACGFVLLLLGGLACSGPEPVEVAKVKETQAPAPPAETPKPTNTQIAEPAVETESPLAAEIAEIENIFELLDFEQQLLEEGDIDVATQKALSARKQEIADAAEKQAVSDNIDLIAFEYRKLGPGKNLARSAFYANNDVELAYQVAYLLRVDSIHEDYFDEVPDPALWMFWVFHNETKTDQWRAGGVYIIEKSIDFPDIPVNAELVFLETVEKKIKHAVKMGWHVGVTGVK